jgi:Tol biopolymer transport system component
MKRSLGFVLAGAWLLVWPYATAENPRPGLPLKPERVVEFTTDEGTWMSVDVSPDRRLISFDLLGDLYVVPFAGGEARRLSAGLAFDGQPRFSPDGKWIAYVSDLSGSDNVWIMKADGTSPRQITKDKDRSFASPRWTSDGSYILVSRSTGGTGASEIWLYGLGGGGGLRLTTTGENKFNAMGAMPTGDQKHLYYARRKGTFSWTPTLPLWQIVRRDLATGAEETITARPGSSFSPVLSHDGAQLVYGSRLDGETGLRVRDLATGAERWLKRPIQRDDQESRSTRDVIPGYAFTPDDSEIVLSYAGKIWRIEMATGVAREIPFHASVRLDLGPQLVREARVDEGTLRARLIQWPRPSPDARRIAFSALGRLYVADLERPMPTRLTDSHDLEFQPAWSPDGSQICYVTWSESGGHLWKLRLGRHATPERLSSVPAYYHDPAWSPDGARIVVMRGRAQARLEALDGLSDGEPEEIVWVASTGGAMQRVGPADGADQPHFSRRPERIYLSSSRGLESVRFDGTDRRVHAKVLGKAMAGSSSSGTPADVVLMAPDERRFLALANKQVFVGDLPPGVETLTVDVSASPTGLRQLSELGADSLAWEQGGKSVLWSLGASVFRASVARAEPGADAEPAAETPRPGCKEVAIAVEAPRDVPEGTAVLAGATLITMRGDEVIPRGDIVVSRNRIVAVGAEGEVARPAGARIIDFSGKYIAPGLIDVHEHWNELPVGVIQRQNWPLLADLAYGVTSTRDPQSRTVDVFLYHDLVETGEILGPRIFSTGPGIFSNTPLPSYESVLNVARRYRDYYRANTLKAYTTGERQLRQWFVQACKETGLMLTSEGAMDLKLDLTHVLDGYSGNEHALPVVPLHRDVVELFARSGISYTPTLVLSYGGPLGENFFFETTDVHDDPKLRAFIPHHVLDSRSLRRSWYHRQEHVFDKLARAAAAIARSGGQVCVGGHGELHGIQTHWEMWALASGGMSSLEVLRAATLNGARAMGYPADLGSLEPGKLADLIVLERDPLADIRNTTSLTHVMRNGRLFSSSTLEQDWPTPASLPAPWWRDDALAPAGGSRSH